MFFLDSLFNLSGQIDPTGGLHQAGIARDRVIEYLEI